MQCVRHTFYYGSARRKWTTHTHVLYVHSHTNLFTQLAKRIGCNSFLSGKRSAEMDLCAYLGQIKENLFPYFIFCCFRNRVKILSLRKTKYKYQWIAGQKTPKKLGLCVRLMPIKWHFTNETLLFYWNTANPTVYCAHVDDGSMPRCSDDGMRRVHIEHKCDLVCSSLKSSTHSR